MPHRLDLRQVERVAHGILEPDEAPGPADGNDVRTRGEDPRQLVGPHPLLLLRLVHHLRRERNVRDEHAEIAIPKVAGNAAVAPYVDRLDPLNAAEIDLPPG